MATRKQVLSDEVRRTWRETLNEVEHQAVHMTVLRYNTPAAVLVPVSWYEQAQALMSIPESGTWCEYHDRSHYPLATACVLSELHGPQEPADRPGAS